MYSNHQGKYDMLGIVSTHDKPCSIVIDKKTTKEIMPRLYTRLVRGQKLDKDPRQQVKAIHQVIKEIIEGRRYLLFRKRLYG